MTGSTLTSRQRAALKLVAASAPVGARVAYLSDQLGAGRLGTITTLDSLVKRGLVLRHKNREGRVVFLATEAGAQIASFT